MTDSIKNLSKFLSFVLRHKPAAAGIALDPGGWADIDALIGNSGGRLTRPQLDQIVAENNKQRFAISHNGKRIRANQGHSIPVDLGLEPLAPPETLYHGTAQTSVESIMATGLQPRTRQHVHLSGDLQTARAVGGRHGKPVVLALPARVMHDTGHVCYRSENGVWLTDHVPPARLVRANQRTT